VLILASLAYAEMRLILARVVWNFDMELGAESEHWTDQKVYGLWQKAPLYIKLTPVRHSKADV
jgi:averantin hydroxylase